MRWFFTEGIYASDGSERDRYETIRMKLFVGEKVCADEISIEKRIGMILSYEDWVKEKEGAAW